MPATDSPASVTATRSASIWKSSPRPSSSSRAMSTIPAPTGCSANTASSSSTASPMPATWRSRTNGRSGTSMPTWRKTPPNAAEEAAFMQNFETNSPAPRERARGNVRARSASIMSSSIAPRRRRRSFWSSRRTMPRSSTIWIRPTFIRTSRRRCERFSMPSARCSSLTPGARAARAVADGRARAGVTLDPETGEPPRPGHRMLDDMLDYVETSASGPVWQPIPDDVRARISEPLPPQADRRWRRSMTRFMRNRAALCRRQCPSRLHGLGAWRRHGRRHAGGNAGRRG